MPEADSTVDRFVERRLEITNDRTETHLDDIWARYTGFPVGVPYRKFKWYLLQSLPDEVDVVGTGRTFRGVKLEEI